MRKKEPRMKRLNKIEVKSICFKLFCGFDGCSASDAMQRLKDMQDDIAKYTYLGFYKSKANTKAEAEFIFKHPEMVTPLEDLSMENVFLVLSTSVTLLSDCAVIDIDNDHFRKLFSEHAEQVMDL